MNIKARRHTVKFTMLAAASLLLMLGFQNCGKVELQSPSLNIASNIKSGSGYICLPDGYTLESFFVTNMNVKTSVNGGLEVDTDGDGLSDIEEQQLGTNPLLRRSSGKILDSICSAIDYGVSCNNFNLSCNTSQNSFGLNECDILALNLNQNAQVGAGIDSDKDGVPDYLEIRINSFPNVFDSFSDLDFDQLNTMAEAERGTSVRNSNNNLSENDYIHMTKSKIQNASCSGEYWKIDITGLPTYPTAAYSETSNGLINLSHAANENVLLYFLKIKPVSSPTDNSKTFSGVQKVIYDPLNQSKSISFDQSLLFFTGDVEQ